MTKERILEILEGAKDKTGSVPMSLVRKAFENIPNESHWIPCTPETMPKKDGEYLVTFEEGYADDYNLSLVGIAPFEVDCEGFGFWKEHFDFASMGSLGSDWEEIPVVAWKPLPSPYREEDHA